MRNRNRNRSKANRAPVGGSVPALRKNVRRPKPEVVIDMGETPLLKADVPPGMPSEVRLGSKVWEVLYAKNLLGERGEFGHTDFVRHRIVVDATVAREQLIATLLHEVLHAILFNGPISMLDLDQQEVLVRALEPGLINFLRDNKTGWLQ